MTKRSTLSDDPMVDLCLRAELERHWEYSGKYEDIGSEVYARDAVSESLQAVSVT